MDIVKRLRATVLDKDNMPRMDSERWFPVGLAKEAADEIERLRAELAAERERCLTEISERISTRLNNHLCEMKDGYDDSITGFNEAWDIAREVFAAAIIKGE